MNYNKATRRFVNQHLDDDVRQLALQYSAHRNSSSDKGEGGGDGDVDLPFALDQIRGRQIARRKLPTWAAIDDILYPPHLSMEQCSSEQTARYKASIVERLVSNSLPTGEGRGGASLPTGATGGRLGSLEQPPMWLRPHKGERIPIRDGEQPGVGLPFSPTLQVVSVSISPSWPRLFMLLCQPRVQQNLSM